jgi:F0F1-type ATP synthase membrane subunit b/b'
MRSAIKHGGRGLYLEPAKVLIRAGMLLFALTAASAVAFAAESGSPEPADSTAGLVFRWLNFLLVFGGLAYLLARYGGGYFRGRAQTITASIREAAAEKAAAEQEFREAAEKITSLDQEIAQMRRVAAAESAVTAERVAESGRREISRIEQASRAEISAAQRAARLELKSVAGGMAVERASVLVRSRMDANRRAALFHTFLAQLAGRAN